MTWPDLIVSLDSAETSLDDAAMLCDEVSCMLSSLSWGDEGLIQVCLSGEVVVRCLPPDIADGVVKTIIGRYRSIVRGIMDSDGRALA
ncbi:hypothetical protein [Candidatus Methanoprimaticola sp. MG2]|uniref:hypothetical protein n=1 Tax=Candidatus Methanoprimaticola sp. MG2 TaxID=3228838 RepID=UPI0039C6FAD1